MSKEDVLNVQVRVSSLQFVPAHNPAPKNQALFFFLLPFPIPHSLSKAAVPVTFFFWLVSEFADSGAASEHTLRWVREEGQEDPPQDRR